MPRGGASAAEKGETIAGAKDAQTRTKSPSNASPCCKRDCACPKSHLPALVAACGLKPLARPPTRIEAVRARGPHMAKKP